MWKTNSFLVVLIVSLAGYSQGVVPHITPRSSGFETFLFFNNHSKLEKVLTLTPFTANGTALPETQQTVAAETLLKVAASQLLPDETTHVEIKGSDFVDVMAGYTLRDGPKDSFAFLPGQKEFHKDFQLLPAGSNEEQWVGIAMINMGETAAETRVLRKSFANQVLDTATLILQPHGKHLFLVANLFDQEFIGSIESFFEINSGHPLAIAVLGGSLQTQGIWQILPMVKPKFQELQMLAVDAGRPESSPFQILSAELKEEILNVTLQFPDACNREVQLFMKPEFMESLPVQADLYFAVGEVEDQACARVLTEGQRSFDLSPAVHLYENFYGGQGEILFRLLDEEGAVTQVLHYYPAQNPAQD